MRMPLGEIEVKAFCAETNVGFKNISDNRYLDIR